MSFSTISLWADTSPTGDTKSVSKIAVNVDVAIIGAGITGMTAAALLKRQGKTVAVIEARHVGAAVSGYTTAHLTEHLDANYETLISKHGEAGARLAAHSTRAAIEQIASLIAEKNIDCNFRRIPGYYYTENEADISSIESEAEAALKVGLVAELMNNVPLPFPVKRALRFENQADFHPLRYIQALARDFVSDSCHVFEGVRVTDVKDGEHCTIETNRGTITAKDVILATHTPLKIHAMHTATAPYRSYVVGVRLQGKNYPAALFWDNVDPYHYIRSYDDGTNSILIVGGEDHKTGQEDHTVERYQAMEAYTRERFDITDIAYHWSAQAYYPIDHLPYIGKNPGDQHVYIATGFGGTGMTFGTLAAMMITDQIMGIDNPYTDLYAPTRFKPDIDAAATFVKENINVAAQFIGDRIAPPKAEKLAEIAIGQGRITDVEGKRVAAYRDDNGILHLMSPICTHMKCIVDWNEAECTWDCPCHGGRFSAMGEVLEGPPMHRLEPVQITNKQTES